MSKRLSLVGSGIKIISHLTKEVESHIKNADIVLYLVNEPIMEEWIKANSRKSKNIDQIYFSKINRINSYELITKEILRNIDSHDFVCVVFYGHPTVFALPGVEAIRQAESKGVNTKIIPSISAEDCLFADLKIDPGDCGCYSVEATDLLIYQRHLEISSHLIIWQIGMLGNMGHELTFNPDNIVLFVDYLCNFYSKTDLIYIYEASLYPGIECTIKEIMLRDLVRQNLSKISTLYIPPKKKNIADPLILKKLGMNYENIK